MTVAAAGFVTSHRGKAGGFTLVRAPGMITVAEVPRATEGPIVPAPCLGVGICERQPDCLTRPLWMRAAELLDDLFSGVTIANFAGKGAYGTTSTRRRSDSPASSAIKMPTSGPGGVVTVTNVETGEKPEYCDRPRRRLLVEEAVGRFPYRRPIGGSTRARKVAGAAKKLGRCPFCGEEPRSHYDIPPESVDRWATGLWGLVHKPDCPIAAPTEWEARYAG